jgi:16S rRNA (guanine966-N2)-methyltransferase
MTKKRPKHKKSATPRGEVRIIGGDFRGRKLPVLQAEGLRPTSDRVRETLFNWLQFEVPNARVLDAFAGSGVLGVEALSRGAQSVRFIEKSADNARQLQQNIQTLNLSERADLVVGDALAHLSQPASEPFDILFFDPPFGKNLLAPALEQAFQNGWIAPYSWLYLEQERTADWPQLPEGWICHREKTTSQVKYGLFHYSS